MHIFKDQSSININYFMNMVKYIKFVPNIFNNICCKKIHSKNCSHDNIYFGRKDLVINVFLGVKFHQDAKTKGCVVEALKRIITIVLRLVQHYLYYLQNC
jgi:hypothetical protein